MAERGSVQGNFFEQSLFSSFDHNGPFSQDCDDMFQWSSASSILKSLKKYIYISAVKQLIAINRIQSKSFWLHNICMCSVYIYCLYINTNTCMYIFQKNWFCLYIKYIYL